ncbi:uncharacterized protein ACA1_379490 [Acanthamoeba castellanii str. Neff]|uniref:Uncharacterized protein n=1 Tax=Acanthamoeba castellanii (strain ATCC 30010 / Neff) TaxID=1257118 RepID=L8GS65_ACACF|nr:uncharacterized protein ACA1_379490 [Acanthamoeba castellanii str. Neff]ELR15767.1 hypothetical protein ACA1_379490 [Acanthamoeba castellanii str. Neff]
MGEVKAVMERQAACEASEQKSAFEAWVHEAVAQRERVLGAKVGSWEHTRANVVAKQCLGQAG